MEKWIATVSGTIGAIVSYAVDGLGLAVAILIVMMAIDYATGVMSGIVTKTLNSRIGFNGFIRKAYYLLLVGAIYAISLVVPGIEYAGDGAAIALCVLELISIAENGVKMKAPMPQFISNLLSIVKDKAGDKQ
jgi:toxin secretion/phage lysis holin